MGKLDELQIRVEASIADGDLYATPCPPKTFLKILKMIKVLRDGLETCDAHSRKVYAQQAMDKANKIENTLELD